MVKRTAKSGDQMHSPLDTGKSFRGASSQYPPVFCSECGSQKYYFLASKFEETEICAQCANKEFVRMTPSHAYGVKFSYLVNQARSTTSFHFSELSEKDQGKIDKRIDDTVDVLLEEFASLKKWRAENK